MCGLMPLRSGRVPDERVHAPRAPCSIARGQTAARGMISLAEPPSPVRLAHRHIGGISPPRSAEHRTVAVGQSKQDVSVIISSSRAGLGNRGYNQICGNFLKGPGRTRSFTDSQSV